ncbi:MAG: VOC family protein [Gaiellaceae bacterium]
MTVSLSTVGAITLFVQDPQRSKLFYQDVFGVSVVHEDEDSTAFGFENMIVNLLKLEAARDLVNPGAVARQEAGSRFQLTVWVDDANAVCTELATRGVRLLNGATDRDWGVRTASFTDPDGHIWEIAQELSLSRTRLIFRGGPPSPPAGSAGGDRSHSMRRTARWRATTVPGSPRLPKTTG